MGARITTTICGLTAALLLAAGGALAEGQNSDNENKGAAQGSHRAAQDQGLDLTLDYDETVAQPEQSEASEAEKKEGEEEEPLAAPGSYRAAQDEDMKGVDWSRRLGKNWRMDPVALNRRQDGRHSDHNADVDDQVLGIEIRRPF